MWSTCRPPDSSVVLFFCAPSPPKSTSRLGSFRLRSEDRRIQPSRPFSSFSSSSRRFRHATPVGGTPRRDPELRKELRAWLRESSERRKKEERDTARWLLVKTARDQRVTNVQQHMLSPSQGILFFGLRDLFVAVEDVWFNGEEVTIITSWSCMC